MPTDYPPSQLMADVMAVVKDNMDYIVPLAGLTAAIALVINWFFFAINISDWTFGRKR